jgi:hypothetical protein
MSTKPKVTKVPFLRSTVMALLNELYERSLREPMLTVGQVLPELRSAILGMETRIWSMYSEDDDVSLFESEAAALRTKAHWEKCSANGVDGPFEHFEQYQLPKPPSRVYDAEMLRAILQDGEHHLFHIHLNGGAISRKTIYYQGQDKRGVEKFDVMNHIDDSWQTLSWKQLLATGPTARTHIGEALEKMALFWEG